MRIRKPAPGMATLPFLNGFSLTQYAGNSPIGILRGRRGNAEPSGRLGRDQRQRPFHAAEPPKFGKAGFLSFAMGQVDLINDGMDTWVVKGPGSIYCDGEIRVKGNSACRGSDCTRARTLPSRRTFPGTSDRFRPRERLLAREMPLGYRYHRVEGYRVRDQAQP